MTGLPQTASEGSAEGSAPRRAWVLGVLTAVLIGLLVPIISGSAQAVWASKVSTSTYDLHRQRDSIRNAAMEEMLVDILCAPTIQPEHRRCR